ncbi:MAG: alpha/beta hydrolase [Terriglobia bacterium]
MLEYDHETTPRHCAVVCHPHPQFGGTMHTKAVFRAAKAAVLEGIPALRFNFRGVGKSQGEFDRGNGEQDDARAAMVFLASRYPGAPVMMMGFSFGSAVALRVGAADERVFALVGMGLPVKSYDYSYLEVSEKPKLFVEGTADEYGPRAQVEKLVARFAPPKRLEWIEGADHYFTGKLEEYQQVIRAFIRETVSRSHPSR